MSQIDLRARSTSEIVDAGFALYRRDAMQYTVITAIANSPALIYSLLNADALNPQTPSDLIALMPVSVVSFLSAAFVSGVVVHMGADVYLGERADVGRTIRAVLPRLPALLLASMLNVILVVLGLVLFIFPGLYALARQFAVVPAVVLEREGPFAALGRSAMLSRGHKGHILMTLLLSYGIYLVLNWGIALMVGLTRSNVLVQVAGTLFNIFAYPIVNLVGMVLYYDMRIRAEGFDLEHMSRQ